MALITVRSLALVTIISFIALPAYADIQLHNLHSQSPDDAFGRAVDSAGDVDADGHADIIVGAQNENNGDGMAIVYSGATGAILYTKVGSADALFGVSVAGVGDVNNDGFDDFAVGARSDKNGGAVAAGSVTVFSGKSGAVLKKFNGTVGSNFGSAVDAGGDTNGDGVKDIVIGAKSANRVYIYSGAGNYALLRTLPGGAAFASSTFGEKVSGGMDFNNDGYDDVAVAASNFGNSAGKDVGGAFVYSGVNGAELLHLEGCTSGERFGAAVDFVGDLNGDGYDEVAIGAPYYDNPVSGGVGGGNSGSVFVFSGKYCTQNPGGCYTPKSYNPNNTNYCTQTSASPGQLLKLMGPTSGASYGFAVAGAGDANGDGIGDIIVGSMFYNVAGGTGFVRLHSGVNGNVLQTYYATPAELNIGETVAGGGDIDGDGYSEFIFSTKLSGGTHGEVTGEARAYSLCDGLSAGCWPATGGNQPQDPNPSNNNGNGGNQSSGTNNSAITNSPNTAVAGGCGAIGGDTAQFAGAAVLVLLSLLTATLGRFRRSLFHHLIKSF